MKPWEQYQTSKKPWESYQQPAAPIPQAAPPQVSGPQEGIGRTAFDQGMQGATFGFADEISDALGAFGAGTLSPDLTIKDAYSQARELTRERQARQLEQNPGTSIAANIAGGLLTGGAAATTKTGAAIGNSLRTGNLAARAVKGAAAGAASGGLYGYGTGEDGNRAQSAKQGAVLGGVVGAAVPAIGATARKLNTKTVVPSSEQVREAGSHLFDIADQKGGALNEAVANKFYNQILRIRPQTMEGRVFKGKSPVADVLDQIPDLMNRPMTLRAAKEVDEALGDMAYGTMDKFGKLTSDGKKFLDMQTSLRRLIDTVDDKMVIGGKEGFNALKEARKQWATSLRMRDIERIIENAQRMEQPATSIRAGFRTLLRNGDRLKGYTPQEIKAIKKAADTGIVTDIFRLAGSGLVPIATGAAASMGGPVSAAVGFGAGSLVQKGSKAIGVARQVGRANDALKTVAKRSGIVTQEKRLQIPPALMKKIAAMPPKAARALLEHLKSNP